MKYEKVTYTRTTWEVSGGLIVTLIVVIALAANHKNNAHDATEAAKWFAIVFGTAFLISMATLTALIMRARKRHNHTPKTIQLYPTYELNNEPIAEIASVRIIHNGEEYVKVIRPDKIAINSQYGKGRHHRE